MTVNWGHKDTVWPYLCDGWLNSVIQGKKINNSASFSWATEYKVDIFGEVLRPGSNEFMTYRSETWTEAREAVQVLCWEVPGGFELLVTINIFPNNFAIVDVQWMSIL